MEKFCTRSLSFAYLLYEPHINKFKEKAKRNTQMDEKIRKGKKFAGGIEWPGREAGL
jgi:hypothetical protein